MRIDGIIEGIKSRGGSYINVLRSMTDGGLGVWGYASGGTTYLLVRGNQWLLVTFDDADWEAHWLPELVKEWGTDAVYKLPGMEKIEAGQPRERVWVIE